MYDEFKKLKKKPQDLVNFANIYHSEVISETAAPPFF